MKFEAGQNYRGRVIDAQIEQIETSGNVFVEAMIEVTLGPLLGRRLRWKGWINSEKNAERTIEQLRAAGWRGTSFGEWTGLGSKEVDFQAEIEKQTKNGKEHTYVTAAFLRAPQELRTRNPVSKDAAAGLTNRYASLLRPATTDAAPPSNGAGRGSEMPGDDYFGDGEDVIDAPAATQGALSV